MTNKVIPKLYDGLENLGVFEKSEWLRIFSPINIVVSYSASGQIYAVEITDMRIIPKGWGDRSPVIQDFGEVFTTHKEALEFGVTHGEEWFYIIMKEESEDEKIQRLLSIITTNKSLCGVSTFDIINKRCTDDEIDIILKDLQWVVVDERLSHIDEDDGSIIHLVVINSYRRYFGLYYKHTNDGIIFNNHVEFEYYSKVVSKIKK